MLYPNHFVRFNLWTFLFYMAHFRDTSTNIERIVAMPTKQNQHLINLVNQQKPAKKTKAQKKAEAVAQAQAAAKLKANAASTKVKPPVQPKSNPMEKVSSSDAQCHGFKHQPPAVKHVSAVGPCSTVSNGQCPSQNCVDLSRTSSPSQAPRFSKLLTEWTINNKMPLPQFISYSVSWSQPNAPKHLIMVSIGNQSWSSFPEHCATPKEAVEMASKKALAVLTSHKSKAIEVLAKIDPESVRTAISILQVSYNL